MAESVDKIINDSRDPFLNFGIQKSVGRKKKIKFQMGKGSARYLVCARLSLLQYPMRLSLARKQLPVYPSMSVCLSIRV